MVPEESAFYGFVDGSTSSIDGTGISYTHYASGNDECRITSAAGSVAGSSPHGSQVWESHYRIGHSGGGPCNLSYNLGAAYDTVHITVSVFWEAGWDPHNISEKFMWLNGTSSSDGDPLFEFLYGDFVGYNVTSATGCSQIEVNMAGTAPAGRSAPCDRAQSWSINDFDGRWVTLEFQMIQVPAGNNGTIRVWQDGNLIMEHTGRTFAQVDEASLWDTYGGAGDALPKEQSKLFARWRIARSAN